MARTKAKPAAVDPAEIVSVQLTRRQIRILGETLALVTTYRSVLASTYSVATGDVEAVLDVRERLRAM